MRSIASLNLVNGSVTGLWLTNERRCLNRGRLVSEDEMILKLLDIFFVLKWCRL